MRSCVGCVISALVLCGTWKAAGEFAPTRHPLHVNAGNFSHRDHVTEEALRQPPSGSAFSLKVQINDVLSREPLSQAVVEVYTNYTLTQTAITAEDGVVLLLVPYQAGSAITIVAGRDGYVSTLLPCKPNRRPIFTSVTVSLLALNQGNIWIFEDSVVITGKSSDPSALPAVQFPKNFLNLTDGEDVSSFKAFLTVPQSEHGFLNTFGITSSPSGYISVELSPLAGVSIQLFSGDTEVNVAGPVQISLSIPDNPGLQVADVIPAWFLNRTTGGWMRKGLGRVVSVEGKRTWTFSAPHLGYWIAAPLSSTRGFFRLDVPDDFIVHYSSFLMVVGGMLLIITCLLVGLLFYYRRRLGETKMKIQPRARKDQSTSTHVNEALEVSSGDFHPQDRPHRSATERRDDLHDPSFKSSHNGSVIGNSCAVVAGMGCGEPELSTGLNDPSGTDQVGSPCSLVESFFYYNQPVAFLQAPAFFHMEEQPEQLQRSKSATLPRSGAANCAAAERLSEDSVVQGSITHSQTDAETKNRPEDVEAPQERLSTDTSRAHFSLLESASVPGTLNKIGGKRHSLHALAELSEIPSFQPPRAWFVSLEGKPAAEIHYAVSEQQRRRRPAESRDTSLDSGVDMSELNQASGRRAGTLERNATFVKNTSADKKAGPR